MKRLKEIEVINRDTGETLCYQITDLPVDAIKYFNMLIGILAKDRPDLKCKFRYITD